MNEEREMEDKKAHLDYWKGQPEGSVDVHVACICGAINILECDYDHPTDQGKCYCGRTVHATVRPTFWVEEPIR